MEELLVEYPPEPVERRRYAKIARALGNRTTKQVASRLQKYFKKLHSAGMPVPGRVPKSNRCYVFNKQTRIARNALRPTTFFPANYVPVTITDDDDYAGGVTLDPNWYRQGCSTNSIYSDADAAKAMVVDEDTDTEANADRTSQMIRLLGRLKRDKEKDSTSERLHSEHDGYKVVIPGAVAKCGLANLKFGSLFLLSVRLLRRGTDCGHPMALQHLLARVN